MDFYLSDETNRYRIDELRETARTTAQSPTRKGSRWPWRRR